MLQGMKSVEIRNVRDAISERIKKTDDIKNLFINSYSEYTMETNGKKVVVLFLMLLIIGMMFYSQKIILQVLQYAGWSTDKGFLIVGNIVLFSVCAYVFFYALRIIVRLSRIAKINGYLSKVNVIKDKLVKMSSDINEAMSNLEGKIKAKNVIITTSHNLDKELSDFEDIAKNYSCVKGNFLDGITAVSYCVSSVLFCIAFLALTGPAIATKICSGYDIDMYEIILVFYALLTLGFFLISHFMIWKANYEYGLGTYVLSLFSGPVACVAVALIVNVIAMIIALLAVLVVIAILIGIVAAILDS